LRNDADDIGEKIARRKHVLIYRHHENYTFAFLRRVGGTWLGVRKWRNRQ